MLARLALVVTALLIALLLGARLHDERACDRAGYDALAVGYGPEHAASRADIGRRARERCGDAADVAVVALFLAAKGSLREGEDLLQEAVRSSPRSFVAWATLARVQLAAGEDAFEARRRARALNPLWRGPAPLSDL